MERLAVGATIGNAYKFVFRSYLALLGITWLPILLSSMLSLFVIVPVTQAFMAASATRNAAALGAALGPFLLAEMGAVLILLVTGVGVTRLVAGTKPRWPFVYFWLGADFWRLLLAVVLFGLICLGVTMVCAVVFGLTGGLVTAASSMNPATAGVMIAPVILVGVYGPMAFLLVRFGMLLPSVVVAEHKIGLGRSWVLSRGNFWRLFAVMLAVVLPMLVVGVLELSVMTAASGQGILHGLFSPAGSAAWSRNLLQQRASYAYLLIPVAILISPLYYGLIFGAGAFCYRALVPATSTEIADTF